MWRGKQGAAWRWCGEVWLRCPPPKVEAPAQIETEPAHDEGRPLISRPATPRKAIAAPQVVNRSAPGGGDTIGSRILEVLKKKPMSSLELSEAMKLEPPKVYGPLHILKKRGLVDSLNDESDGTRRWFIARAK